MQLLGFRTCSWDLARCSVASAERSNEPNERCHGDALRLLCQFVPWKHPRLYSTEPWKENDRQPLGSSWEVASKACCLEVASSHPQMEWVAQSPGNKLNKSAKMTAQCPASTHHGTDRDLMSGCQGLGTAMKLEEQGWQRMLDVAALCFWIPGQRPVELCMSRASRTGVGEEPERVGEKQNRLCPGAEEKPFSSSPASDRLQHLGRGDSAPAVPASTSSSSSAPCRLPSPGLCSSSLCPCQPPLRAQCILLPSPACLFPTNHCISDP